jgi:hypothetical protein
MLNCICFSTSSSSSSFIESNTNTSNDNTSKFTIARIILFYSPENEYDIDYPENYSFSNGFSGLFYRYSFGLTLFVNIHIINGTITVQPLDSEEIILDSGDKISMIVTFVLEVHKKCKDSGFGVVRAFGVTIEKA